MFSKTCKLKFCRLVLCIFFFACNDTNKKVTYSQQKSPTNTPNEKALWARLIHWTEINAPAVDFKLNAGATEEELENLEKLIQHTLPEDFKNFYRIHNGQSAYRHNGLINTDVLMSINRISAECKQLKSFIERYPERSPEISNTENVIKNNWWNPLWVPIIDEGTGDFVCIDLDPLPNGQNGQIMQMIHDDYYRPLLDNSFHKWFENYIIALEAGEYVYSEEWGGIINKEFLDDLNNITPQK